MQDWVLIFSIMAPAGASVAIGWWAWHSAKKRSSLTSLERYSALCGLILASAGLLVQTRALIVWHVHPDLEYSTDIWRSLRPWALPFWVASILAGILSPARVRWLLVTFVATSFLAIEFLILLD